MKLNDSFGTFSEDSEGQTKLPEATSKQTGNRKCTLLWIKKERNFDCLTQLNINHQEVSNLVSAGSKLSEKI